MSNLSTSNSDLNRFVRGFLKRLGILSVVLAGIFFISFDRSYYYSIPKDTTYHKVYWVYNRLMQGMDEQNVLFMGSSICQNGINDSLLNQWDEGANHYYNFGVTHSCNAITYELLKEVLEYRGERPSKVYLCLKSDARPTKFHAMYPVIASSGDLLESAGESNVYLLPTLLKRVAWNGFGATQIYTMPKVDRNNELGDDYGYIPSKPVDSTEVIRIYNQEKENVSGVMRHYEATLSGEDNSRGFLSRMNRKRMNLFSNSDFQDVYFEKCAALLEAYSIPFDIIVYPNYGITVAGNSAMTGQYYQQYYSQIDYEKHRVISLQLEALKSPSAWRDMNHLSKEGATIFTRALLDTLGH